jgi:hypothetical protein
VAAAGTAPRRSRAPQEQETYIKHLTSFSRALSKIVPVLLNDKRNNRLWSSINSIPPVTYC